MPFIDRNVAFIRMPEAWHICPALDLNKVLIALEKYLLLFVFILILFCEDPMNVGAVK
jgi:hypothetical protein